MSKKSKTSMITTMSKTSKTGMGVKTIKTVEKVEKSEKNEEIKSEELLGKKTGKNKSNKEKKELAPEKNISEKIFEKCKRIGEKCKEKTKKIKDKIKKILAAQNFLPFLNKLTNHQKKEISCEAAKKKVRKHLQKIVKHQLEKFGKSILNTVYLYSDKEVDKIYLQKLEKKEEKKLEKN